MATNTLTHSEICSVAANRIKGCTAEQMDNSLKTYTQAMMDLAKEGRTMLIVTHQLEFARAVADRIVFIDEGVIVEEAKPEEFFTNPKTERAKKFLDAFKFEKRVTYAEMIQ